MRSLRNKFGAVRTSVDGVSFASRKEARRYNELKILLRSGHITDLTLQPRFKLSVNGLLVCTYVGDYQYRDKSGALVIEDAKGVETPIFKLKRKLMKAVLGLDVVTV